MSVMACSVSSLGRLFHPYPILQGHIESLETLAEENRSSIFSL